MAAKKKVYEPDPIREAKAAAALRESLLATVGDDGELLVDMIEGETSLFETIDELLVGIAADEGAAQGVAAMIATLDSRKARFEGRVSRARALIEQALMIAEVDAPIIRPGGTLSLSTRAPSLVVTDEAEIPSAYWKAGKPTLDRPALTGALREAAKAREAALEIADEEERTAALAALSAPIPGATLSNAAPSLTIRVK